MHFALFLCVLQCLLFQTGQRLGIKPLGEVIQQVTGDALPDLLRLACCRYKYTTAGHALLNHDATYIGLLHAGGPSSEGSSNGAGAVCIEQEEQEEQQQDSAGQQAEDQDAGQSAAQLICECMETCIVKDNYELLECLVTLPGAGLIGELVYDSWTSVTTYQPTLASPLLPSG